MSRTRSPNYPAIDLANAIELVEPVYRKEKRNKMPREVLATHLGYNGLNGRALGIIGALRAYGLLEGTGDEVRVGDDTVTLLNAPDDSPDRKEALQRCALRPTLFRQLHSQYETIPSEGSLRYALIKLGFTPEAAGKATHTYLATISFVGDMQSSYDSAPISQELTVMQPQAEHTRASRNSSSDWLVPYEGGHQSTPVGMRKEVVTLDEGEVVITFPSNLTAESYADLRDHLNLFLRKMERRAKIARPQFGEIMEEDEEGTEPKRNAFD
ncbi:hypothetical protein NKH37_23875 [Mesorhizobium sp. M1217]|uniref:hypothetical protein n=1 Tax=Mesorhizobium sp. M1217 TaxID=2957070 RepID=UPI00333B60D9